MKVRVVWIGKTRNRELASLIDELLDRTQRFVSMEVTEIRDPKTGHDLRQLTAEEERLLDTLDSNGMHIIGQDADELKLGYLLCALSQQNEIPPADSAAYMNAARTSKLCYYVSTTGAPTGAQVQQGTDAWQNQQNAPGIDNWNDIDPDRDGHTNSDDYSDYDPGTY